MQSREKRLRPSATAQTSYGKVFGVRSLKKREQASAKFVNNSNKTDSASGGNKRKNKLMKPHKTTKIAVKTLRLWSVGTLFRLGEPSKRAQRKK